MGHLELFCLVFGSAILDFSGFQTSDNTQTLDIDGRPRFAKRSIDNGEKVKIAAIDPDLIEAEASIPDGMR
jgi:hypothetical protein